MSGKIRFRLGKWQFLLIWFSFAILLPSLLGFLIRGRIDSYTGVRVTCGDAWWEERSYKAALDTLSSNKCGQPAEVCSFVWSRKEEPVLFLLKGKTLLTVGTVDLITERSGRWRKGHLKLAQGFSSICLHYNPPAPKDPMEFLWSKNFATVEPIRADHSYISATSSFIPYAAIAATLFGIASRFNIVMLVLFVVLLYFRKALGKAISENRTVLTVLVPALLVMFWLRFDGMGYLVEEGIHPDEQMIRNWVLNAGAGEPDSKQFWYPFGHVNTVVGVENLASWVLGENLPGHAGQRFVSAFFSCLSCILLFSCVRVFFGESVALVATFLHGFLYMPIQLAHFGIVEPAMVALYLLALRSVLVLYGKFNARSFAIAGFFAGIAIAVKQTAVFVFIPFVLVCVLLIRNDRSQTTRCLKYIACYAGTVILGFSLLSPQSILYFPTFYEYQLRQWELASGNTAGQFYFLVSPSPFNSLFLTLNNLRLGVGIPVLLAAIAGCVLIWKRNREAALLLVPGHILYFGILCVTSAPADRYALILCPFLAMMAAVGVTSVPSVVSRRKWVVPVVTVLLLIPCVQRIFWLQYVLHRTDTRREATRWCYQNLPPGAAIDYESFGPRFLIRIFNLARVPTFNRPYWSQYTRKRKPEYYIADSITRDLFTRRVERFPAHTEWYRLLEEKGQRIHEFQEERLRRYDMYNPDIRIYKISW